MQTFLCLAIFLRMFLRGVQVSSQGVLLNDNLQTSTKDNWSSELTKRLETHSCRPGPLLKDTTLLHGLKAGTFNELGRVKDVEVCVLQCCETRRCELALFMNNYCYGITCYSQQHCKTVPALANKDKTVTVLLYKTSRANMTSHLDQEMNQSKSKRISKKHSRKFVFYPVDSDESKDLAFSVNLRKIASHYTDNEKIKTVLTQKANEYLAENREAKERIKNNKTNSTLDELFSRDQVGVAHRRHTVVSDKRGKMPSHQKENNVNAIEWNPKLLKAAISSSSVAILIVVLILLAMSRKNSKATGE